MAGVGYYGSRKGIMKFTYYDQTVEIFPKEYYPDGPPERIMVNVSGGLDSASLLFLLCTYFPEVEKHIFTGDDVHAPYDSMNAQNVVQWCEENIPNHNIKSHDLCPYDDRDPKILEEVRGIVDKDPSFFDKFPWIDMGTEERSWASFLGKIAKPMQNLRNQRAVMQKYGCTRYMAAMTQNPPNAVMKEGGWYHLAETKRNEDQKGVHIFNKDGVSYHPYARVDKMFVRGVFEAHDLMGEYYELTGSCTGGPDSTDYFMKPCEICFWCHEKKWAFGKY